ncbi:MAG TPA: XdhC family protein [Gallionellaceae bacterium]
MDSTDQQVLKTAVAWLDGGRRVALATVAQTWGSSPRPPGAWMALRDDGAIAGSVSGGCIEEDLVQRTRSVERSRSTPEIVTYGVKPGDAARFGLPCGGTVQLVVEHAPEVGVLREMAFRLAKREVFARTLHIASGRAELDMVRPDDVLYYDGTHFRTIHGPQWRLLIIGAGQVSQYLAHLALALDYEVVVCDPRAEYRDAWRIDGAKLVTEMPDDAVLNLGLDGRSAVVALTHDPKLDDLALIDALRSSAFYIGCLGSRTSTDKRKERLRQHFDLSEEELQRLHAPVGLPIGSHTPPEIALSIMAEITALKNRLLPRPSRHAGYIAVPLACGA